MLLKIGEKTLENSNGKEFKIVTLKFKLPSGEEVERSGICYAANYEYGIEKDKSYLCNLSLGEDGSPQIRMSHISNAERASKEDFAGLFQVSEQLIDDEVVI
ncbi:MAG: hypothetical protein QM478_03275 [Flavobacteriaceae bacterium]